MVIGADLIGHVREGNMGDEDMMGTFGIQDGNAEGPMVVDIVKRMGMVVVNTFRRGRSLRRSTQVDHILYRQCNLKEISDRKVVIGESVARQHKIVVCRMTLVVRKLKRTKAEQRIKWWKVKREECRVAFREVGLTAREVAEVERWRRGGHGTGKGD